MNTTNGVERGGSLESRARTFDRARTLLPTDDLGLRAGFRRYLGARRNPSPKRMEQVARAWRPWRTLACLYLWALLDNPPDQENAP